MRIRSYDQGLRIVAGSRCVHQMSRNSQAGLPDAAVDDHAHHEFQFAQTDAVADDGYAGQLPDDKRLQPSGRTFPAARAGRIARRHST